MKSVKFAMVVTLFFSGGARAESITSTAHRLYDGMPQTEIVDAIVGNCGADENVNDRTAFCTSENIIYVANEAIEGETLAYELSHQFAMAIFVRTGLADAALAAIRSDRSAEAFLRGQVTRQVTCLAGFLYRAAGYPKESLFNLYGSEPFTDAHWGRNPLRLGPRVSIGLDVRDRWFAKGQSALSPLDCGVPELPNERVLNGFQGAS